MFGVCSGCGKKGRYECEQGQAMSNLSFISTSSMRRFDEKQENRQLRCAGMPIATLLVQGGRRTFCNAFTLPADAVRIKIQAVALICVLSLASMAATNSVAQARARTEKFRQGDVELTLTIDPEIISLDRDLQLTIRASAPSALDVELPSLDKRLTGFAISRSFDREPVRANGLVVKERCVLLTPLIADEYRIAPLVVRYSNALAQPPEKAWFPTQPIHLSIVPLLAEKPARAMEDIIPPVWIPPSWKTVAAWVLIATGLLLAVIIIIFIVRRIRHAIRLHRLSPRERALRELEALMSRNLIGQDRVKDFYVELTMIVRRYIERAHGIRAPEQTTEEFMAAVTQDPRFTTEIVRRLSAFLESADLVKYAAFRPPAPVVESAVRTSREYIDSDSALTASKAKETGIPQHA